MYIIYKIQCNHMHLGQTIFMLQTLVKIKIFSKEAINGLPKSFLCKKMCILNRMRYQNSTSKLISSKARWRLCRSEVKRKKLTRM